MKKKRKNLNNFICSQLEFLLQISSEKKIEKMKMPEKFNSNEMKCVTESYCSRMYCLLLKLMR